MSVILEDRPIDQVREEAIDILIYNYSHGVISAEAFERRLDIATESQIHSDIVKQVADLPQPADDKLKREKEREFSVQYDAAGAEQIETMVNILGGSDRSGRWSVPREVRIFSLFGGSNLDFTDAVFTTPNVTVKVLCLFGGDNIYIPEHVNVVCKAFCVMGGVDNLAPSMASRQGPTLTVEGLIFCGGLDIKIKTSIKEKFVAFANKMKTVINQSAGKG